MKPIKPSLVTLHNTTTSLVVDPLGGAIVSFQLNGHLVNPLSFKFSNEQMPLNNRGGAVYQGHFACIGRWGAPSAGEILAGIPSHGEAANIEWTIGDRATGQLKMYTIAAKEGLKVTRNILLDNTSSVYLVNEIVTNINPLGRVFNMVQHPTIASPFLNENTFVNCNASKGFNQANYKNIDANTIAWPMARDEAKKNINLQCPGFSSSAVYSFIVNPQDSYGWITAFSPAHQLLIGYLWKRSDYPWIHQWLHYSNDILQYRGIEFGTAGIHQPFDEIMLTANSVFGEKTFTFIDAGESITKRFLSFCYKTPKGFKGVESMSIANEKIVIHPKEGTEDIFIKMAQKITNELYK